MRWFRFICFFVLFTLLLSIPNIAFSNYNERWIKFYKLPRNSIDVLFMGNSHSFATFQPQIIDEVIPVNSYVIGIGGENIVLSYFELKEILKYQHPRVIVLETFALDLDDRFMPTQNYYEFLDSGMWNFSRISVADRYVKPDMLYTLIPALRQRMDWSKPSGFISLFLNNYEWLSPASTDELLSENSLPITNVISETDYLADKAATAKSVTPPAKDNLIYFDKFYKLCQDEGIKLILTTTPMVTTPQTTLGRYAPVDIKSLAQKYDLPWLTYDTAAFNHLHFSALDHVNGFGSLIISLQMAEEIAGVMDLPINQQKVDYFSSMIFSDYQITMTGGEYRIELYPKSSTTDLLYKWTLSGATGKIYQTDWQKERYFTFQVPDDGELSIQVKIRNKSSDYSISAVFKINKPD